MALIKKSTTPYNRFNPQQQKKDEHRINADIRVPEVRVTGDNVESRIVSTREAIQMAEDLGVDLVEISPNAVPPVCRLIDYTKFLYEKKKKEKEIIASNTPPPAKRQDQPYPHVKPNYGAKKQYSQEDNNAPALNKAEKNSSKRSAECSFFSQGRLMGDYSLPSALSRPNRRTRRRKQWCSANNF